MKALRVLLPLLLVLVALGSVAAAWALRYAELPPIRQATGSFDKQLIARGRDLAALGNCGICHSSNGGQPYAGGLPVQTPFGTIYTTNITPDSDTGIGSWSEEAFRRAMHEGIHRSGKRLYPAFPYNHFTKVTSEDVNAIYAFLRSEVKPARYQPPENQLPFPFNFRWGLAAWNFLFLEHGEWKDDPSRDAEWNRGAYLVEGVGHCGACHTPRNVLGAEKTTQSYSGGLAGDWYAPSLIRNFPARIPWTQESLVNYLIDGWSEHHGIAAGPMTSVVDNIHGVPEDDAFAIAAYILSLQNDPLSEEERAQKSKEALTTAQKLEWGHAESPSVPDDPSLKLGAKVFEAQCASCHHADGQTVPLAFSSKINAPDPFNVIHVTLQGIQPPRGAAGRSMPARGENMSDSEVVALLSFMRSRFSHEPAWSNVDEIVRSMRRSNSR